jgi:uncharacterized protein (TIGR02246 family)
MEKKAMKSRLYGPVFCVFALFLASLIACGPRVPSTTSADRKTLAAVVQEIDAAYNAQDADRFSAVFAEDGNFQFPVEGIALHGREEIRRHFVGQFATLPPMRHVTTPGDIDVIVPGLMAVDIQVDILSADTKAGNAQALLFHYMGLGLGVRTDSGWRIRLVRLYPAVKRPAAEARTAG